MEKLLEVVKSLNRDNLTERDQINRKWENMKAPHRPPPPAHKSQFGGGGGSGVTSDSDSKLRGGQLTTAWRRPGIPEEDKVNGS
jgi:hypothetical protein